MLALACRDPHSMTFKGYVRTFDPVILDHGAFDLTHDIRQALRFKTYEYAAEAWRDVRRIKRNPPLPDYVISIARIPK
jgi:hypothetical protein